MSFLALIPARGGSKRIPRKNIRSFCGRPIITYSIELALKSGIFSDVIVSTDDEEIADIAREAGASVPFLRSSSTADDNSGILDVIREVLEQYQNEKKVSFSKICCILPTAPMILPSDIIAAKKILDRGFNSVVPVVRFSYPILRSFKKSGDQIVMNWPEHYASRSQDLPPAYHDAGQFYWLEPEVCLSQGRMFTSHTASIELPEMRVQDIDEEIDWKIAEFKYKTMMNASLES